MVVLMSDLVLQLVLAVTDAGAESCNYVAGDDWDPAITVTL
jgi:hypothetical protein